MQAIHDPGVRGDDLHEPEPEAAEPATPGSPSSARGQLQSFAPISARV
jgi:hypothetical protein